LKSDRRAVLEASRRKQQINMAEFKLSASLSGHDDDVSNILRPTNMTSVQLAETIY
jgi:uncharacterized membrane protein